MTNNANGEAIKGVNNSETMRGMVEAARAQVASEQMKVQETNQEAARLEQELLEAQAAHEQKEKAEQKGKETKEKVDAVTGNG